MDAIERLDRVTTDLGVDWGLWTDRSKVTRAFHYEVRVFGSDDLRVRECGGSMYEAAAKAADKLSAVPNV